MAKKTLGNLENLRFANRGYARTDMAVELLRGGKLRGCVTNVRHISRDITRTDVEIRTERAAELFGKPVGNYWTIEVSNLYGRPPAVKERAARAIGAALSEALTRVTGGKKERAVLAACLGNGNMTADALGPLVMNHLIVGGAAAEGKRDTLRAVSPGVLGITGIETHDLLAGLTARIKPDAVIAVDTLASRSTARIASAFQIADTGIIPGGGVGNRRARLSRETLGVPVVAVGVPLVIYASTICEEALNEFLSRGAIKTDGDENEAARAAWETPGDLIVTPKDIDVIVADCARVLGLAVNIAARRDLSLAEIKSITGYR